MASILIKTRNKFRMWNTTVDMWESDLMTRAEMVNWLIVHEGSSKEVAEYRCDRRDENGVPYTQEHLASLAMYKYAKLNQSDKRNRSSQRATEKKEGVSAAHRSFFSQSMRQLEAMMAKGKK